MEQENTALIEYLSQFVTPERLSKMHRVVAERTRYLTVVLEDIFQPHNASAVLRSCDAFGVQDVHIIEDRNSYQVNPDVELGTSQWLTLQRYKGEDPTVKAITALKSRGYRIVATSPRTDGYTLANLPIHQGPIALMFGTELTGLTPTALELADDFVTIPMFGFVESFNISVSAALCLYDITTRLRKSELSYKLQKDEQDQLLLTWLRKNIKKADALERAFKRSGSIV
ncbi:MAG: RNA methyltransferase [Spirochaetales bacterium]|nr:RNA methyltransferase [Spirochaetales bacterium]